MTVRTAPMDPTRPTVVSPPAWPGLGPRPLAHLAQKSRVWGPGPVLLRGGRGDERLRGRRPGAGPPSCLLGVLAGDLSCRLRFAARLEDRGQDRGRRGGVPGGVPVASQPPRKQRALLRGRRHRGQVAGVRCPLLQRVSPVPEARGPPPPRSLPPLPPWPRHFSWGP